MAEYLDASGHPVQVGIATPEPIFVERGAALSDRSGTITLGGTSQTALAANLNRKYLLIVNPPTATELLWVDLTGTAVADSPSLSLAPGGNWLFEGGFVPTNAVSVQAPTTGHKYTIKEG